MSTNGRLVLVVGATGSIGRPAVDEAIREGYAVRALVRNTDMAHVLPSEPQVIQGDLTLPETLTAAVDGVDAIVVTHATTGGTDGFERVDYGGVRNVLRALGSRSARIALMTAIGVTNRTGEYKRRTGSAGVEQDDFDALFARLDKDPPGALDGVHDVPNMPRDGEPQPVRDDLNAEGARRRDATNQPHR